MEVKTKTELQTLNLLIGSFAGLIAQQSLMTP
jgi:hypothetical protein